MSGVPRFRHFVYKTIDVELKIPNRKNKIMSSTKMLNNC